MTEIPSQSHAEEVLAELVKIPVFQDQTREELLWFISVSEERPRRSRRNHHARR